MKTPLLLLHGALGSAAQVEPLAARLAAHFDQILTLDFPGHGSRVAEPGDFSIARFADALLLFLEEKNIARADLFGYSMGGYVALELAVRQSGRVRRVATLGTKSDWSPASAELATAALDPEKWLAKAPTFVEMLKAWHGSDHWLAVVEKTKGMMRRLGSSPELTAGRLADIRCPALVMVGELDNTVGVEESRTVAGHLQNGQFSVLPEVKHPFEQVDLNLLAGLLADFMGY